MFVAPKPGWLLTFRREVAALPDHERSSAAEKFQRRDRAGREEIEKDCWKRLPSGELT